MQLGMVRKKNKVTLVRKHWLGREKNMVLWCLSVHPKALEHMCSTVVTRTGGSRGQA